MAHLILFRSVQGFRLTRVSFEGPPNEGLWPYDIVTSATELRYEEAHKLRNCKKQATNCQPTTSQNHRQNLIDWWCYFRSFEYF
jgi:hypothetical protein